MIAPGRARDFWGRVRDAAYAGSIIFASGLGLAAAGLLPRLLAVQETNVAGGQYTGAGSENYSSGWSLSLLFTRFFERRARLFLGPLLSRAARPSRSRSRRRSSCVAVRPVPYFAGLTLVVSTLTLAKPTIIHKLFFLLPKYQELYDHVPTRVVAVQWIGPAILAGATIDILAKGEVDRRIRFVGATILAVWTAAVIYLSTQGRGIGWPTLIVVGVVCSVFAAYALVPVIARAAHLDGANLRRNLALLLLLTIVWEPTGRVFAGAVLNNQVDAGHPARDRAGVERGD